MFPFPLQRSFVSLAATVALLMAWPSDAHAKLMRADSVEWMAADADLVVLGTIHEVETASDTAGNFYGRCKLHVNDRLKGDCPGEIRFFAANYWPADALAQRQKSGQEVLLFLKRYDADHGTPIPPLSAPYVLPFFRANHSVVTLDGKGGVLTMDSKKLTDPAEILQAVKAAIRAARSADGADRAERPRDHVIDTPADSDAFRELYSGSVVLLRVPVNDQLQERARRWLQSDDVGLRLEGAKALAHFKNEENEALLRAALRDEYHTTITRAENGVDRQFTLYDVRQAAHEALSKWKVDLAGEPPFEVPVPDEDDR